MMPPLDPSSPVFPRHQAPGAPHPPPWALWGAAALSLLCVLPASSPAQVSDPHAQAQELLDAGRATEAKVVLDHHLDSDRGDAQAFLLRSTAQFQLGEIDKGEKDLRKSLKLDPELRQGWLNLAGLMLSRQQHDDAFEALMKAKELDPQAPDNDLNLGAVLLLRGQLEAASRSFEKHLERNGGSSDAHYLVASNYANAGYEALAIQHLQRAVAADERSRIRARTDANFSDLADDLRFQEILNTDVYELPPGAYYTQRVFNASYEEGRGRLLGAVIDALRRGELPFNPHIEVAPDWALIRGEVRIKVSDTEGRGLVELSAPAESLRPVQWQQLSESLLNQITYELAPKAGAAVDPGSRR